VRIIICDDDAHLRTVLRSVATDRGHEVVGEAETAADAYDVLARTKPDAAIVDLALRVGSGREVARRAAERGCRVIVFSSFVDDIDPKTLGVIGVPKPDFAALESALDALWARTDDEAGWRKGQADRRTLPPTLERPAPKSPVEEPGEFYQALSEALPGDTVMFIDLVVPSAEAAGALAVLVRSVIRANDHLMQRGDQLIVLLVDALPEAADAVMARLTRACEGTPQAGVWQARHTIIGTDETGSDAFQRLRATTAS
jgi:CheY-like chemotaxis protein